MDIEKYKEKAKIINQISQYTTKINDLTIQLEENNFDNSKQHSKLTKGIGFINFFITKERKHMKEVRRKYYKEQKR